MLSQNPEQGCILCLLQQFLVVSNSSPLISAEHELSTHLVVYPDVKLGDMDMVHYLSVLCDSSLNRLL